MNPAPLTDEAVPGIVIAAPASGSGKTLVTLGLLRHFRDKGLAVASAKVGPDYIDPAFHAVAGGRTCVNLDLWAMRPETRAAALTDATHGAEMIVCEGVMGLFDGAHLDEGSTAHMARDMGWPVILVVDAKAQGASAAALVSGFARHRADVTVAGVIFNRTGSDRHADILRGAMAADHPDIPVLGCLPRLDGLTLPERHLGLVQAQEHGDLDAFLDLAARAVGDHIDTGILRALARNSPAVPHADGLHALPPLGQRIAVARDAAFSFVYPHVLDGWRRAGAEISYFSPLDGDGPPADADAVYLPGGYPELHAGRIAAAGFLHGLRAAADAGKPVFGECGGYMVLGSGLTDADGARHAMAGLLPVETSFAERKLHLGYRRAVLLADGPLGPRGTVLRGHEFHYATILSEDLDSGRDAPLFQATNARGEYLGALGRVRGPVTGSFIHLIDREDSGA